MRLRNRLFAMAPAVAAAGALAAEPVVQAVNVSGTDGISGHIAPVGDLTGDGVPEFAVGAATVNSNGGTTRGIVSLRNGATGEEAFRLLPEADGRSQHWGTFVYVVGDLDGDDVRELAVCNLGAAQLGQPPGFVDVVSLSTKTRILRLEGTVSGGGFGASLADLGDVTGDGVPDILIGEPGSSAEPGGAAWVFSGADGTRLDAISVTDPSGTGRLGSSVAAAGDLDGDGVRDYVVGAPGDNFLGAVTGGRVILKSGRPGGFEVTVRGSQKAEEHLGRTVAVGDLDGDGSPEIVAAGGGRALVQATEFIRIVSLRNGPAGPAVRGAKDIRNVANVISLGARLVVLPDLDGSPGGELLVVSNDTVQVFSRVLSAPTLFWSHVAPVNDTFNANVAVGLDYGRDVAGVPDPTPDGNLDLLLGTTQAAKVFAMPLRVPQLPPKFKQKLPFTLAAPAAGPAAKGRLVTNVRKGQAAFDFVFSKLPSAGVHTLHVEDAPGSGTFRQVGSFSGAAGTVALAAAGGLPAAFGTADPALLGGRVVELRDAGGTAVLTSVFPYPSQPQSSKSPLAFAAAPSGPAPAMRVTSSLKVDLKRGKSQADFVVKGAPKGTPLSLWGETAPGSGAFAKIGDFSGGTLRLDTKSAAAAFPRIDLPTLLRRLLEVRDDQNVVYAGTATAAVASGPRPDLRVSRVSLRYRPVSFDWFEVRVNVANRGTADAGPVNVTAVVWFYDPNSSDVQVRTVHARTSQSIPVGSVLEDVALSFIDNPFPGELPDVDVEATVDPATSGSWGEVNESDETNNTRVRVFLWNPTESEYDGI